MKTTKYLALFLAVLMLLTVALVGCGQKDDDSNQTVDESGQQATEEPTEGSQDEGQEGAYDGPKVLDYYVGDEPQTMDAQQMFETIGITITAHTMEGLMRQKTDSELVPGVAESYTFDEATSTYTFKLNPNAKWQDGEPVTADDFIFAWKLAIDTQAPYSFLMTDFIAGAEEYAALTKESYLKENAEDFKALMADLEKANTAEEKEAVQKKIDERVANMTEAELNDYNAKKDELWKKVGIKVDGQNFSVTMARPCPFFPSLTGFSTFYPMSEKFYNEHKDKDYALEASGLYSNGPWMVTEWKHDDYFKFEKNPNYWNKDNIKIDVMNWKIVTDVETRTNLLKTGKLDGSAIQAKDLPDFQDVATLEELGLQPLEDRSDFSVFYIEFNHFNNPITQNLNIRKALAYACDRQSFVEKINLGDEPALAYIPKTFPGLSKTFREENGERLFEDNQKDKAKEFLAAGLKELNMTELPPIDMLIGESDIATKIAEKFQADWKEVGITVNLVPLPWGEQLTRLQAGDFAMSSTGWGPDYLDPMTYLDIFQTGNGNNHGQYSSKEYDTLIENAKNEKDPAKRMEYLYQAEKHLIDNMVIAPQYFRNAHWTFKKYVTGVVHRGIGANTDFYWADIDMNAKMEAQK